MTTDTDESPESLEEQGFVAVCETDDVPSMRPKYVEVEDRGILICRRNGEFSAVDEICPHERKSMRYGVIQRGRIICPHHRYKFELEHGECQRRRCPPVPVYDLEVLDDTIYVRPEE